MRGFGWAIDILRGGGVVARTGWNGKGMFLFLVSGGEMNHPAVSKHLTKVSAGLTVEAAPYIAMYTAQRNVVPWLASQTDVLAEDWDLAA